MPPEGAPVTSDPPRPCVGLTFDDGPDPVWTPRVLAALAAAGARATFFVMSSRAVRCSDLIAATLEQGHEVGLHCARHLRHTSTPRAVIERDTVAAMSALAGLGVHPRRWRLPWGARADWSDAIAREYGLAIVDWSADTHDWRGDRASRMLRAVKPRLKLGAVVLMHDGIGPGALRSGCAETVRLIAPLTAAIRRRGFEPERVAAIDLGSSCR